MKEELRDLRLDGGQPARPPEASEGMILAHLSLEPVAMDSGGQAILRELNGGEARGAPRLPPQLAEALRGATPYATVRIGGSAGPYSCRVFLMHPHNGLISEPLLAIHLRRERSVTDAVRRVGRTYHLTDREQETLVGISMGLTSKELAQRMNISPNTVNAFLRLIMVKMGVTTRAGVVGKLINGKAPVAEP